MMQNEINNFKEKVKTMYIHCIQGNYTKLEEELLQTLFELNNLSASFPMEKQENPKENSEQKIIYDLRHTDKRNNKFYFYPVGETEFKDLAFKEGKIFVRVFHPDGKIENTIRKIHSKWTSSVLWNINSMFTKHVFDEKGKPCKYSKASGLKVYACPISFKDSIPDKS